MKIMIDAGHFGKYNQSPCNPNYYESEVMWKLQNLLCEEFKQYGADVRTTRSSIVDDLSVTTRGTMAKGCDILISLHSNAVGSGINEDIDYPLVFVPINGQSTTLGNYIATAIQNVMNTKQKGYAQTKVGVNNTDYYGIIRGAVSVGVPIVMLIEHSFHTNTRATNWLLNDENLKLLAEKEAALIAAHYNLKKGGPITMETNICGHSLISPEALAAFVTSKNPSPKIQCDILKLAQLFVTEGNNLNIRGDIAFCQSIHETGWFKYGGLVLPEQNNYAGIGATNNSAIGKGAWFDTPEIGVRAQIQHLFAYATKSTLPGKCVDPRFNLVTRGIAPTWEQLNGRWAVPGTTYGQSILALYSNLEKFAATLPKPQKDEASEWAKTATDWCKQNKIFVGDENGKYNWQKPITREELAQVLYSMTVNKK